MTKGYGVTRALARLAHRSESPGRYRRVTIGRLVVILSMALVATTLGAARANASSPVPPSAPKASSVPLSAPKGCFSGYFCSYNSGNGGNLCFQTTGTTDYPPGCAYENDGAYNNSVHNTAFLNYYSLSDSNAGAYYVLDAGHYLLYMTQNKFNACWNGTTSCPGYGHTMWDSVGSVIIIAN